MSIFDPEAIVRRMIAGLGVKPEDFVAFVTTTRDEILALRADRLAFKPASVKAYTEIMQRLERIEAKQQCIFDLCQAIGRSLITDPEAKELLNEWDSGKHDLNG